MFFCIPTNTIPFLISYNSVLKARPISNATYERNVPQHSKKLGSERFAWIYSSRSRKTGKYFNGRHGNPIRLKTRGDLFIRETTIQWSYANYHSVEHRRVIIISMEIAGPARNFETHCAAVKCKRIGSGWKEGPSRVFRSGYSAMFSRGVLFLNIFVCRRFQGVVRDISFFFTSV